MIPFALQALAVSKKFGTFAALQPLDFSIEVGEVRGLVGSNGAGKTTFIKVLTGAHRPTTGTILVDGHELPDNSTAAHLHAGIACIYQHSSLAPNLTVLDNLYLGRHPCGILGIINRQKLRADGLALLTGHGVDVEPDVLVETLPTVKQKQIEILKALAQNAKIILMDEPTAWLSHAEVKRLHETIARLQARGIAIVYISHMINEIFQVCDSVSVLRDGTHVWTGAVSSTDRPELIQHMLGESASKLTGHSRPQDRAKRNSGAVKLSSKGLCRAGYFFDVNFDLHAGEILCVTGLIGAKRTELVRCLFGADRPDKGTIEIDGAPVQISSPRQAMNLGIGFVPEDRHRDGLFLTHSIRENLVLAALSKLSDGLLMRSRVFRDVAARQVKKLNIVPTDPERVVGWLSGGNQQKILLGKWLETNPSIIILDEPTVGVDVGAKAEIYAILDELKRRGAAVLVVSSDIEEVQAIADRIAVMADGCLGKCFEASSVTHAELIGLISGNATA